MSQKIVWQIKKIDEVCNITYGTRVVNRRDGGTIFPVYGGGGATFFMDEYNREDCMVVARFAMSKKCTRFVKGKFFLNDSGLTVLPKSNTEISREFLDYQLILLNDHIYSLARGSAQKNLDLPAFRKVKISYPENLSEQQRIVKVLDDVFDNIAKAKENAEKNLVNSKELFESCLQSAFNNNDWDMRSLGEVIKLEYGKPLDKKDRMASGIYAVYGANGEKDRSNKYYIDKPSIIVGRKGSAGEINLTEENFWPLDVTYFVTFDNKKYDLKFIYYLLLTLKLTRLAKGVKPGINRNDVYSIVTRMSDSLNEQKNIVLKLDSMFNETKKLQSIYEQKIADLEELKKSILQKAFAGEL